MKRRRLVQLPSASSDGDSPGAPEPVRAVSPAASSSSGPDKEEHSPSSAREDSAPMDQDQSGSHTDASDRVTDTGSESGGAEEEEEEAEGQQGSGHLSDHNRDAQKAPGKQKRTRPRLTREELFQKHTSKAAVQDNERINPDIHDDNRFQEKPMVELEAGSNVWYQAYLIKESANEVKIKVPLQDKHGKEKPRLEWLKKGSSRIWHGSLRAEHWRHLGKGAWEPKVNSNGNVKRLRGSKVPGGSSGRRTGTGRSAQRTGGSDEDGGSMDVDGDDSRPGPGCDDEVMSPKARDAAGRLLDEFHQAAAAGSTGDVTGSVGRVGLTGTAGQGSAGGDKPAVSRGGTGEVVGHASRLRGRLREGADTSDADHTSTHSLHVLESPGLFADQHSTRAASSLGDPGLGHHPAGSAIQAAAPPLLPGPPAEEVLKSRLSQGNAAHAADPLMRWFIHHMTSLAASGMLNLVPDGNLESGALPPGFTYNPTTRQMINLQSPEPATRANGASAAAAAPSSRQPTPAAKSTAAATQPAAGTKAGSRAGPAGGAGTSSHASLERDADVASAADASHKQPGATQQKQPPSKAAGSAKEGGSGSKPALVSAPAAAAAKAGSVGKQGGADDKQPVKRDSTGATEQISSKSGAGSKAGPDRDSKDKDKEKEAGLGKSKAGGSAAVKDAVLSGGPAGKASGRHTESDASKHQHSKDAGGTVGAGDDSKHSKQQHGSGGKAGGGGAAAAGSGQQEQKVAASEASRLASRSPLDHDVTPTGPDAGKAGKAGGLISKQSKPAAQEQPSAPAVKRHDTDATKDSKPTVDHPTKPSRPASDPSSKPAVKTTSSPESHPPAASHSVKPNKAGADASGVKSSAADHKLSKPKQQEAPGKAGVTTTTASAAQPGATPAHELKPAPARSLPGPLGPPKSSPPNGSKVPARPLGGLPHMDHKPKSQQQSKLAGDAAPNSHRSDQRGPTPDSSTSLPHKPSLATAASQPGATKPASVHSTSVAKGPLDVGVGGIDVKRPIQHDSVASRQHGAGSLGGPLSRTESDAGRPLSRQPSNVASGGSVLSGGDHHQLHHHHQHAGGEAGGPGSAQQAPGSKQPSGTPPVSAVSRGADRAHSTSKSPPAVGDAVRGSGGGQAAAHHASKVSDKGPSPQDKAADKADRHDKRPIGSQRPSPPVGATEVLDLPPHLAGLANKQHQEASVPAGRSSGGAAEVSGVQEGSQPPARLSSGGGSAGGSGKASGHTVGSKRPASSTAAPSAGKAVRRSVILSYSSDEGDEGPPPPPPPPLPPPEREVVMSGGGGTDGLSTHRNVSPSAHKAGPAPMDVDEGAAAGPGGSAVVQSRASAAGAREEVRGSSGGAAPSGATAKVVSPAHSK